MGGPVIHLKLRSKDAILSFIDMCLVRRAGLKDGDIIIEVAGNRQAMSTAQFNLLIRLNYQSGDRVPVKILRRGQTLSLQLPMP